MACLSSKTLQRRVSPTVAALLTPDLLHRKTIRECGTMEVVDKHLIRFIEGDPDENKVQAQAAFATLRVLASDLSAVDIGTKYVEMCMKVVLRFYDAPEMQDIIFAALQVLLVITEWNGMFYDLNRSLICRDESGSRICLLRRALWSHQTLHVTHVSPQRSVGPL